MDDLLVALTLVTALGFGLAAGVFFAFSSFAMKGLARLPAAQGIAAMQAINVAAITFAFMFALLGTAVAGIVVAVWALADWSGSFSPYLLAGSALYLVGTIGLTITYHVPRNDALARVEPTSADAASHWARYVADWTAWNHVRAAAALAAAGAFTVALHLG
jgi:uncharacterized membrane protein